MEWRREEESTMKLVLAGPYFKITCPRGLVGHIVTGYGTRGVFVASIEEAQTSLVVAQRRGLLDDIGCRTVQLGIEASDMALRVEDARPTFRAMNAVLNVRGVIRVYVADRQVYVVPEAGAETLVGREVGRLLETHLSADDVRRVVESDDFTTPFLDPDPRREGRPIVFA